MKNKLYERIYPNYKAQLLRV